MKTQWQLYVKTLKVFVVLFRESQHFETESNLVVSGFIDWLIDLLMYCLIDWLIDWLILFNSFSSCVCMLYLPLDVKQLTSNKFIVVLLLAWSNRCRQTMSSIPNLVNVRCKDTKGTTRSHDLKDRQHNDHNKYKTTNPVSTKH